VAQEIGLPVVLKPQDGNQGKGVTVNVASREHLEIAYRAAEEIGHVMVEKFLPGSDFRLLVVGNKLVAAARRDRRMSSATACRRCASWWTRSTPTRAAAPATPPR
jgi:D-alanine-D-alanine ligase-like ATP-grasp enzyme